MNGPVYEIITTDINGTVLQYSNLIYSGPNHASPITSFASISEQNDVKHVSIGNYITPTGEGSDPLKYLDYSAMTPESSSFQEHNGYNLTDINNNLFYIEQKIKAGDFVYQYGKDYFIEYEKLNILGFVDANDSPNYVLKDSVEVAYGSGNTAGTILVQLDNNKIHITTGDYPKVPGQENPATIRIIASLKLSSDDYNKAFALNMNPEDKFSGFGYVFYDSVLVQEGFTVTFDSQGGSAVPPITGVEPGSTIEPPDYPPHKEHYDFLGWFTEPEFIHEWDFRTDIVTEDITLYAKYELLTWTVTFNSMGGTQVAPYTSVVDGSTIPEPSTPEKLEKDFGGWYKNKSYTQAWNFDTDVVTHGTTLYAKWIDWSTSRISNPNAFSGMPLTLTRGRKVRREFRPFR